MLSIIIDVHTYRNTSFDYQLHEIPLYDYSIIYLNISTQMGICVVSSFA